MAKHYGAISYTAHGHAPRSVGMVGNEVVVEIRKNKNHTYSNTGIYSVIVRGKELRERFRGIDEARRAGQVAYEASGEP